MTGAVTLSFPPESANKLGLETSPDDTYRLSWIELAFRLTQASGKAELASADLVRRGVTAYGYAKVAARSVLERTDWQVVAWRTGLLTLVDAPEQIRQPEAACFLESFFLAVFTQPERSRDLLERNVNPRHIAGWTQILSCEEFADLARSTDERQSNPAERDGWQPTILFSALNLYLCWSGQGDEPGGVIETTEPDSLPIPI